MFARTFRMVPRTLVNVYRNIRDDRFLLNVCKNLQNSTYGFTECAQEPSQ